LSKQYIDFSYDYLYVSDVQTSIQWYYKICGFQVLEMSPQHAVLEISPGQILCLTTGEEGARISVFFSKELGPIRQRLLKQNVELEEDSDHWIAFRDPDHNKIGVWIEEGANLIDFQMPNEVIHNTNRFYLETRDESYYVIRSIADQSEFQSTSEALIQQCKDIGLEPQSNAITLSKFSAQVDAFYSGVAITKTPNQKLPEGSEYLEIPAQAYSVYPIHKTKLNELRTTQLVNRVHHANKTLTRPDQFYILEHYIDEEYIEAYIPYVWNDNH